MHGLIDTREGAVDMVDRLTNRHNSYNTAVIYNRSLRQFSRGVYNSIITNDMSYAYLIRDMYYYLWIS